MWKKKYHMILGVKEYSGKGNTCLVSFIIVLPDKTCQAKFPLLCQPEGS